MLLMLCYVRMTAIGKFDPCVYVRVPIAKHNSCSRAVYGSVVLPRRRCNYLHSSVSLFSLARLARV